MAGKGLSRVSSSILLRPSFVPQLLVEYRTEPFICISLPPLFEIYLCPNPLHSLVTHLFWFLSGKVRVSRKPGKKKKRTKPVVFLHIGFVTKHRLFQTRTKTRTKPVLSSWVCMSGIVSCLFFHVFVIKNKRKHSILCTYTGGKHLFHGSL